MILPTFESRQLNVNTNVPNHECVGVTVFFFFKHRSDLQVEVGKRQYRMGKVRQAWAQGHQGDGQKAPVNEFV